MQTKNATLKKITLLLSLILLSYFSFSQNLIINFSGEDTIMGGCPSGLNQVDRAKGWMNFRSSPDYFHSCSSSPDVSVPQNVFGYQCPANGNAYFGIIPIVVGFSNYREFFGTELSNPLIIGQKIFVSYKIVLAEQSGYACNKLGVLFTTYPPSLDTFGTAPLKNFAQIYTDSIITNTANWITISKSFVADSNYSFVIFGNLFDDSSTDTMRFKPFPAISPYYLIDDICVSSDSLTCVIPNGKNVCDTTIGIKENTFKEKISIFPNPAKEKIFIETNQPFNYSIYNLLAVKIISENINSFSKTEIDVSKLPNGMYFLIAKTKLNTITQKFSIIH